MFAPASVFASPEDVLDDAQLSKEQKIEIPLRWAYDAAEEAVAVEEGMPGRDSDLARRIFVALGKLNADIDIEHTGPSKHHGYRTTRRAMRC